MQDYGAAGPTGKVILYPLARSWDREGLLRCRARTTLDDYTKVVQASESGISQGPNVNAISSLSHRPSRPDVPDLHDDSRDRHKFEGVAACFQEPSRITHNEQTSTLSLFH